jgi:hypothetical protein
MEAVGKFGGATKEKDQKSEHVVDPVKGVKDDSGVVA